MPEQANTPNITGGCQCGAVRYALKSEPTGASICHCRMCQKAFGNYFAPLTGVPIADLEWTRGEPGVFKSSEAVERGFCRDCGTPLSFRYVARDRISVSIGSLDEPQRGCRRPVGASRGNRRPFVFSIPCRAREPKTMRRRKSGRPGNHGSIRTGIEPSHRALFSALAHHVVDMRRHGRVGIHQLWRSSASSTRSRHAVAALTVTLRRRRWMIDASPKKSPAADAKGNRAAAARRHRLAAIRYMACASSPLRTMNSPGEQLCERRRCMRRRSRGGRDPRTAARGPPCSR